MYSEAPAHRPRSTGPWKLPTQPKVATENTAQINNKHCSGQPPSLTRQQQSLPSNDSNCQLEATTMGEQSDKVQASHYEPASGELCYKHRLTNQHTAKHINAEEIVGAAPHRNNNRCLATRRGRMRNDYVQVYYLWKSCKRWHIQKASAIAREKECRMTLANL